MRRGFMFLSIACVTGCGSMSLYELPTATGPDSDAPVSADDSTETAPEDTAPAPSSADTADGCADVCGTNLLETGPCSLRTTWSCDATANELCLTASCDGATLHCTHDGSAWAWRADPSCDDGDACTWADACVAGTCSGQSVSCSADTCTDRVCNGTATCTEIPRTGQSCDDGDPCTWGDACTASGTCQGNTITCTGDTCVNRTCNGTASCTETPRTGQTCDDGNPCTWGDACTASGTCSGIGISCLSDGCMSRSCNGSAACSSAPVNIGGSCDDGDACTVGETCSVSGVCGGGSPATTCGDGFCGCGESFATCPADCPFSPPPGACVTGSQSRDRCSGARTISRGAAAGVWQSGNQSTCSANNRHSGECPVFDVGNDHTYAIFMRAGERATVTLASRTQKCNSNDGDWHSRLKFKWGADATSCPTLLQCWAGPRRFDSTDTTRDHVASADGWLFIIVDGGASGFNEHRGHYTLGVHLTQCDSPTCGC